ncbi:MAG: anthranilate synthase component I family protein [Bacteroidales bacterium]|nr:anthranilate synthase component I family protein [Bacteroidales bacterium]
MKTFRYKTASKELPGDLFTPVSAYLRVRDASEKSILMESSDYHTGKNSKSYIAFMPLCEVGISHGRSRACFPDGSVQEAPVGGEGNDSVGAVVRGFMDAFHFDHPDFPACQLWGYTTFNTVTYLEGIPLKDEIRQEHDAPDMLYILFRYTIEFDHFRNRMTLHQLVEEGGEPSFGYVEKLLGHASVPLFEFQPVGEPYSTLTDGQHLDNIRRGISHCLRGDVFQIVLSRRFVQHYQGDDFKLYRALRGINPSPYLFYMDFDGFRIFGSSPETHCRIEGGKAFIDPIAGTTRRTGDDAQDAENAEFLRNDPKENAEHVMLVDLARNDLSRNCHGVHVDFYKELQYYSHVIHLVSRVSGDLDAGADPVKVFLDTFPAGTLSGAPKVRAMQLISEMEPHNRGAYGGCVGSIGFGGSLNQAITIRTFVSRGGELWFQAGGGIVARSIPENELQEVNNKLGALRRAIETASQL